MIDLVFIATVVGFFGVAVLFIAACERLVGTRPDDPVR